MSIKKQYIPAPLKSAVKNGYVTDASEILDENKGKRQNVINQETDGKISDIKGGSSKSIADLSEDISNEAERASGVEAGLRESIDELGQIGLDPDNAISTDGDDFDGDTTVKRSKIPTIGAIIDGNPGVYDISKRNPTGGPNSDGKFTLEYILANANTLIPTSWRHGGMIISFVHSSDNKYVQYRLTANEWSTAVANWQEDGDTYMKNSVQSSDLDLSDNDGNVLVCFADGHIKTKNFDSAKNSFSEENASKLNSIEQGAEVNDVTTDNEEDVDLNISDEEGNVLIQAKNGHIRTKNFDSAKIGFNRYNLSSNVLGFNRCPDIWTEEYDYLLAFVYGQSFTIVDDGGYKVTDEFDENLYIFEDNQLKSINTSWWSDEEYLPISAMNIISKVCRKYGKKAPQFIIINVGKGNRTCLELMKESSIRQLLTNEEWTAFSNLPTYENRYSAVTSNLAALKTWATTNNKKIICPFFMFLQGESDTHSDLSGHGSISCSNGDYDTYKERLSVMLSDLKADIIDATEQDVAPAAFIDNIGNGVFKDALSGISQAQTDVTIEMDGVYSCGPYYAYPMYAAHPTPDGRRWIGEVLAKLFYNTFIGCRNSKMFISSYKVEGNNVILNILSPCPPLVIDDYTSEEENMCGFKAYDLNMDEITIKSIEVSCSQVVLELASIPSSDFYISYGGSGYGNIRDSSNWNACYKYESNALGDEHSIAHYPKDKEGNAIIGEYYPMWNWLPCGFIEITI